MPGRLQDKVAVITGASSGIGRAIAFAYSAEGAHVVCADIRETNRAATKGSTSSSAPTNGESGSHEDDEEGTTHDRITARGGKAIFVSTDVTKAASVEALVAKAVEEYGRLDIMVNNAGVGGMPGEQASLGMPVWDMDVEW